MVYVDDLLIAAASEAATPVLLKHLAAVIDLREGDVGSYLGVSIVRNRDERSLWIAQSAYTRRIVEEAGMGSANANAVPLPAGTALLAESHGAALLKSDRHSHYKTVAGQLLYLAPHTRPDISFAIRLLCNFTA